MWFNLLFVIFVVATCLNYMLLDIKVDKIKRDSLNKDQVIATISKGGKLDMEMIVSSGRGYVPSTENKKYIEVNPTNILSQQKQKRLLRSDIILASDFQSYSICVEVLKEWFFEKFEPNYFNSIYVDGGHSFDEFRKFADIKQQIKQGQLMRLLLR